MKPFACLRATLDCSDRYDAFMPLMNFQRVRRPTSFLRVFAFCNCFRINQQASEKQIADVLKMHYDSNKLCTQEIQHGEI